MYYPLFFLILMIGVVFSLPIPIVFGPSIGQAVGVMLGSQAVGVMFGSQALDVEFGRPRNIAIPILPESHSFQIGKGKFREKLRNIGKRIKKKFGEWIRKPRFKLRKR
ncbi:hypothetical protein FQA39_LY08554 [Lamprigera yunnana]|nr:hypothetical protein FQA39_LY08554 [Lamprigera yunnana]